VADSWHRILIEEWDSLSIEGCEATSQARHMARERPFHHDNP
jgi:hypothetical protein